MHKPVPVWHPEGFRLPLHTFLSLQWDTSAQSLVQYHRDFAEVKGNSALCFTTRCEADTRSWNLPLPRRAPCKHDARLGMSRSLQVVWRAIAWAVSQTFDHVPRPCRPTVNTFILIRDDLAQTSGQGVVEFRYTRDLKVPMAEGLLDLVLARHGVTRCRDGSRPGRRSGSEEFSHMVQWV